MKLEELRKRVDLIDTEIVKLLGARMELALRTGKHKEGVADPKREECVLANVKKHSVGLVRQEFSEGLFKEIISESKKIQERHPALVAFQGEHGAFGKWQSAPFCRSQCPSAAMSLRMSSKAWKAALLILAWCLWKIPSRAQSRR